MKKFFFFAAALVAAVTINAKDCTWNFTTIFTENKTFEIGDGKTPEAVVEDELYVYGNGKDKGWAADVAQSSKYFGDFLTVDDQDANKKLARLKSQGTGYLKDGGVYGAIAFKVSGNSEITIAAVSSSGSAVRKMQVLTADGTEVASFTFDGNVGKKDNNDQPFVANYTGAATTLYIVSAPQAVDAATDGYTAGGINFYKVAATNVTSWSTPETAINNTAVEAKATKYMENGALVIVKNGVKYNALGAVIE